MYQMHTKVYFKIKKIIFNFVYSLNLYQKSCRSARPTSIVTPPIVVAFLRSCSWHDMDGASAQGKYIPVGIAKDNKIPFLKFFIFYPSSLLLRNENFRQVKRVFYVWKL